MNSSLFFVIIIRFVEISVACQVYKCSQNIKLFSYDSNCSNYKL